jgi:outer membrane protein OmpA-like peptidoglycan-associated protein
LLIYSYLFVAKRINLTKLMKHLITLFAAITWFYTLHAQDYSACENHPLFNKMPQHSVSNCQQREFENITIYSATKDSYTQAEKGGSYLLTDYKFDGEWEKRPSMQQIFQNYINAVNNAGGKVLYKSASEVHLSIKKSGNQFWVVVSGDGSGYYTVVSIQEAAMKQDIVISAEQIKKDIASEGKAIFYGIYFDTGKSTIKPESADAIREMANYLTANPSVSVYIVGHTDNTGSHENNMTLSMQRAQAVVSYLTQNHQVSANRLQAAGVGPLAPITTNKTEEGKSKNRRVEMTLK